MCSNFTSVNDMLLEIWKHITNQNCGEDRTSPTGFRILKSPKAGQISLRSLDGQKQLKTSCVTIETMDFSKNKNQIHHQRKQFNNHIRDSKYVGNRNLVDISQNDINHGHSWTFFGGTIDYINQTLPPSRIPAQGPSSLPLGSWTNYHPGNSSGWASSPRRPGDDSETMRTGFRWICRDRMDLHLLNVYIYIEAYNKNKHEMQPWNQFLNGLKSWFGTSNISHRLSEPRLIQNCCWHQMPPKDRVDADLGNDGAPERSMECSSPEIPQDPCYIC